MKYLCPIENASTFIICCLRNYWSHSRFLFWGRSEYQQNWLRGKPGNLRRGFHENIGLEYFYSCHFETWWAVVGMIQILKIFFGSRLIRIQNLSSVISFPIQPLIYHFWDICLLSKCWVKFVGSELNISDFRRF